MKLSMTTPEPSPHDLPLVRPPAGPVHWADDARRQAFDRWLGPLVEPFALVPGSLRAASADASFRRYLRIDSTRHGSLVVMDAPPRCALRCRRKAAHPPAAAGLHGPRVHATDEANGFLLLEDLGQRLFIEALNEASPGEADALMRSAIGALVRWQRGVSMEGLPAYAGPTLQRGLNLFPEWCVEREYGVSWGKDEHARWQRVCDVLIAGMDAQPRIAVHRDWMPRNLMVAEPNPAILDF
jgi:N-acetylmuramate 1-kinase